jgi:TRAP-type C4-dicarboxylate transport system substrate-binding protein
MKSPDKIALRASPAVLGVLVLGFTTVAGAQPIRVNLGTLAPRGTIYHQSLQAMAEKWRHAPGGGVRLVIYPGGTQGSEADMVRLMRVGTLQAGLLTAIGLSEIEPGVGGLQNFPLAFRDFKEFDYVQAKLRPLMEKRMSEKGFIVLFWADGGWVRYFFKEKTLAPDELRRRKTFVSAGDTAQVDIMKELGYNPVPLETSNILTGLQTGLIDATPSPPIYALANQFQNYAPHMLDLKWAIIVGGLVVKKEAWDRIPDATREVLLSAATQAGQEIQADGRKEAEEAVVTLQKRGLTVHPVTPEIEAQWQAEMEKVYPKIRGRIVPADIFDEVMRLLKEYRSGGGGK